MKQKLQFHLKPRYALKRCSVTQSFLTLCDPMDCSKPGLRVPHHLLKFAQVHVRCIRVPSINLILWCSFLLLPSILPSIRDFSNELAVIRWPKYRSFSFISASNEYSWLISLKVDWFDLLVVQGTFRSFLFYHSSKASILWHSAFTVQLSQLYVTTGKATAFSVWTFVSTGMPLLFNTLSRFVTAVLPKRNHLLISWLQSQSAVILEPKRRKSVTTSTFSPSICYEVMRPDAVILVFLIFSFKLTLSLSSFTLTKRLLSSFSLSAIRVVPSVSLRLLMFLLPTDSSLELIQPGTAHVSSTRLNKQGKRTEPCPTPFSILNQSVIPYRVHQILPIQAFPLHSFLNYHQFTYITEFWLLIFKSFC